MRLSQLVRRVAFSLSLFAGVLCACPLRGQAQDLDGLLERARAAQSSGEYAEAAAIYARATTLAPATPELWSNRGVMEYLAGEIGPSVISLKHALRLRPTLYIPMLFLGKGYIQSGKPELAVPYLNKAHTLQPSDPEVLLTLAKANAVLNKPREAESAYATAARLTPDNPAAWLGLGTASLNVVAADGQDLATIQPQSVWARALFADELLAQGRPLEAVDTYNRALAKATPAQHATLARTVSWLESHPDLFPIPANSQTALQKLDEQLSSALNKASLAACDATAALLDAAACAFWAGDYEHSAAQADEALKRSPQEPQALYWSIKSNERMAVAALARFEDLAPHSAASFDMVGDLYRDQRQMDSALGEYRKALEVDPHDPGALLGSVVADIGTSRLDEAAATDRLALADRPQDPQLNLLMAEILAANFHYVEARPYLAKCAAGPPEMQPRVHLLLAHADAKEGSIEAAIREYQLALPGDQDGSIHFQLSRLYRKTGNVVLAQKAEDQAKALIAQRRANANIEMREMTGGSSLQ
ncbi:tetratricopeptide repeat protein [Tunturiibacter empetritectus]|uniref:Tetratricopeptide (TPR) repeat protein n=1 Tax=Tunturiibacter lichenicola TaxID=2051959 RepID=A0A852VIF3_9BACT|nr:tetratricopeptide repeat protein [Edaphobacter lichenicola]NYF90234.1 tetratricopeptide (TPR) repeat protein [Edaphobacter lichenicola]